MPRTAPTVDGAPTFIVLSLRYQDASGDLRTESLQIDAAATNAEIETAVTDHASASNAVLYEVRVQSVYASVPDKNNAIEDDPSDSVFDNIVILAKTATGETRRGFILAPKKDALMVSGTDQIDPASVQLATYLLSFLALLPAGFTIISARYTERREINEAVKI